MLATLIEQGFGTREDYNCSEKILCGANQVYDLGIDERAMKLSAVFGGGMATGRICGALVSALMVVGYLNTKTVAHESPEVKEMAKALQESFEKRMGSVDCSYLKETYWNEEIGCHKVILAAAKELDEFLSKQKEMN